MHTVRWWPLLSALLLVKGMWAAPGGCRPETRQKYRHHSKHAVRRQPTLLNLLHSYFVRNALDHSLAFA
jgi:hypothetical protein